MQEQEAFNKIDLAIDTFKAKEGLHKSIKVSKKPHTDWLVYNWRQLTWTEKGINYLIEIYPKLDNKEKITGWNLYAGAYYDLNEKRYYVKKHFAESTIIDSIAQNAIALILESYKYLNEIKHEEITFSVELS